MISQIIYTKNNASFLKKLVKDSVKIDLTVEQYMATGDCCFKAIQIIIQDWRKEKISINNIKNKLIEEYTKLDVPATTLILEKQNVSTWTLFSLVNFLAGRKSIARDVIQKPEAHKNTEIVKQITQSTYMPTDFDFFLLCKVYKVPVIITMSGKQATSINSDVKILNTSLDSDKEVYVIILTMPLGKTAVGIVKYEKLYKIPKSIINATINSGEKDIDKYITDSLKFQEMKKRKKLLSDRNTQRRKRDEKGKIKKRIKLPSK